MNSRAEPTQRRTLPLPPEICAIICEGVGRNDLVTLCRTSRLFGDQAQRMLYRTVDLSRPPPRALSSWCLAVNRRPPLAERVHTLRLGLPRDLAFSSDVTKIARALSRCINLKELFVHVDRFGSFGPQLGCNNSIQGYILTKCPFRLTKFYNGFFKESFLAQFWTPQVEIRVLALPNCGSRSGDRFPLYEDQVPNLIALEVGGVEALPHDRPLQRIQLHCNRSGDNSQQLPHNLQQLLELGRYSASLTTLNIVQYAVQKHISTFAILHQLADVLPALVHLALIEGNENTMVSSQVSPLSGLARFKQLQTLVLYCQRITAFGEYCLDDVADLSEFASEIMKEACPTLRRAVVAARHYQTPSLICDWSGGSERWETTLILTRAANGEIKGESRPRFNFREFSMFWED
ncbi:hypothetical protein C8R46DRAFT_1116366 [Mycena filopes]|nr:hypothetical protein C8R46DRAFT_1116366 [Mycena filopes]